MAKTGDKTISYEMNPLGLNGHSLAGGNLYANANSREDAEAWANRVVANGTHQGYVVSGVSIVEREMVLGLYSWELVRGGIYRSWVVECTLPIPLTASDEGKRCDATACDGSGYHERRADFSCRCGHYSPQKRYVGPTTNYR